MSDIKPIETRYKGYRFRSRLEARWAVFFDALGIKYEYEPQGWDLDGKWYLPDFWLPEQMCFLEIKPLLKKPEKCLKIYLAGKIARLDWRHSLVFGLEGACAEDVLLDMHCGHVYSGPFFSSVGHGQDHGPGLHGMCESGEKEIVSNSFSQIEMSDVVVSWIEDQTCYGSLVEIGYARGIGVKVLTGFNAEFWNANSDSRHDLWFANSASSDSGAFSSPSEALASFLRRAPDEVETTAAKLSSQLRADVMVVRGTPDPNHADYSVTKISGCGKLEIGRRLSLSDRWLVCLPPGFIIPGSEKRVDSAMTNARGARFEHGECG